MKLHESELILNPDGSIYHLNLLPEDIADTIITVGDPDRVAKVSKYFDRIEIKKQRREYVTHTGYIGNKRITVLSTGIGTDNIDIVFNELDALVNIDFDKREIKPELKSLNIVRVGTSGGLHEFVPVDSRVISQYAIGLDGLGNFYQLKNTEQEKQLHQDFIKHFSNYPAFASSYISHGSASLIDQIADKNTIRGITVTCGGFYGPQGRTLRAQSLVPDLIHRLQHFESDEHTTTNFEMETAGIYAMGNLLGHHCCSISTIINNRVIMKFTNQLEQSIENLIQYVLEKLT